MFTWRWVVLGTVCAAACGCGEPPGMVSAGAPGTERARAVPESETKDPAAAIGEQVPSVRGSAPQASTKSEIKVEPAPPTAKGETKTTASGVKYETLKEGTGAEALPGKEVSVHYVGTLDNGTQFDSSRDRSKPFDFTIGKSSVITGWHEGVAGMKVGETRRLIIPPSAGYGEKPQEKIPPDSTLHFDIELLGVK